VKSTFEQGHTNVPVFKQGLTGFEKGAPKHGKICQLHGGWYWNSKKVAPENRHQNAKSYNRKKNGVDVIGNTVDAINYFKHVNFPL